MSAKSHNEHDSEYLCTTGAQLYEEALREGRIPFERAASASCLIHLGLVHPALDDQESLEPVAPTVALHRLLRDSEERITSEWQRKERLAGVFASLIQTDNEYSTVTEPTAFKALSGTAQINGAISEAMTEAREELLSIQPSTHKGQRNEAAQAASMARDQALLNRGGRIRTLYQHTQRHVPLIIARYEQLHGDAEARTLDEVTDRLLLIDRRVAFIPGAAAKDGSHALEVRHPALISFFVTTFERLWRLGSLMYPKAAVQRSPHQGITPRQRAIAGLLIEGHTDAVIADRLGMNVRTARVHISKLAATLGSESRAQLGYLIGQSGFLDQAD
ncbi:LuxR C-terminal-related transcriptional regulator [Streptomyces chartreusis]|uniref:helix-turn-helix transcriptional regulator n=1 Tax=Streptomyces chartreusis TaxID=1969 RepID=UPI00381B3781